MTTAPPAQTGGWDDQLGRAMELHNHVIEQIVIAFSGKASWFGAATSVTSGAAGLLAQKVGENPHVVGQVIEASHVGMAGGLIIGAFSAYINWRFTRARDIREQEKRNEERAEEDRKREIHTMQKRILEEKLDIKYGKDGMIE